MSAPKLLIVAGTFYRDIADALIKGAKEAAAAAGASAELVEVPGALEIPGAIVQAEMAEADFDGGEGANSVCTHLRDQVAPASVKRSRAGPKQREPIGHLQPLRDIRAAPLVEIARRVGVAAIRDPRGEASACTVRQQQQDAKEAPPRSPSRQRVKEFAFLAFQLIGSARVPQQQQPLVQLISTAQLIDECCRLGL